MRYDSLAFLQKQINIDNPFAELANQEYEAFIFTSDGRTYQSRKAKKTPLKKGYFLAFWQKNSTNTNEPFDANNSADYLIVSVLDEGKIGYFEFTKAALIKHNILTNNNIVGKMAFRVYPTWEYDLNKTALKTQSWQSHYFTDLSNN